MARGNLRIYMGAAAGAGTTFAMLEEAQRRQTRGTDIVVGCVDTHGRPSTASKVSELIGGNVAAPAVLDLDGVLARRPTVVLVDDLATANVAGSRNRYRWQDIDELLNSGIDVISTLTIQHVESLADPVRHIVGAVPEVTVPDEFLNRADQIELIDIAPEAIRRRIAHGNVFARESDPATSQLFNSDDFARLRVLMLFWMADHLAGAVRAAGSGVDIHERVVVALSGAPSGDAVVRRAARLAQRSRAVLVGVHVHVPSAVVDDAALARQRGLLGELGGAFRQVESHDVASALVAFADAEAATQLVIGTSGGRGSVVEDIVALTPPMDVLVVSHDPGLQPRRRQYLRLAPPVISRRRRLAAFIGGALLLTAMTLLMVASRDDLAVATSLTLYLLAVVGISALGGWLPGLTAAVVAPLLTNWFLIEPYHTLRIDDPEREIELVVFVSVAIVVSAFVSIAARRAAEAERARHEAASLAALAGSGGPDALQLMADQLCTTFALEGVAILDVSDDPIKAVTTSGERPPLRPDDADFTEPIGEHVVLAARGGPLTADELRVLHVFVQQLSGALERHRMTERAAESDALARADELRNAILRAVSHDLRSPLAGIKASVSSLRQHDVEWPDDVRDDFLASIEDETDRLTTIVSNLLDMSRLQTGTLTPAMRPVTLEEVVPAALHSLGARASSVELSLPTDLADVLADPALLERVVANLVSNAVEFSPPGESVRVTAGPGDSEVHLYVIDHGRGIGPKDRAIVLQPFHRLSDSTANSGVGLGLAIAQGLTAAMGGHLELRDTPGGGLTAVITLLAGPAHAQLPAHDGART